MQMIKFLKRISLIIIIGIFLSTLNVFAETGIQCSTSVDGTAIQVSGQLLGVNKMHNVTILLGNLQSSDDVDNILYIDQIKSDSTGNFVFNFRLDESVPYGDYTFKIGSDTGYEPYTGVLEYYNTIEQSFISADIDINITGYTPVISGTLSCIAGKTLSLQIENTTDDTVIANETISSSNGEFILNYTLPNLLYPKNYSVTLLCSNGTETLADMSVNISSSTLLLSIEGQVATADNVKIFAEGRTTNTGLFDKNTTFSGNRSMTMTIPNVVANMSFELSAIGYERVTYGAITGTVTNISNTGNEILDRSDQTIVELRKNMYTDEILYSKVLTPDENNIGHYDIPNLTPRKYVVKISRPGYVTRCIGVDVMLGKTVTIPEETLLWGDLNGDGYISTLDSTLYKKEDLEILVSDMKNIRDNGLVIKYDDNPDEYMKYVVYDSNKDGVISSEDYNNNSSTMQINEFPIVEAITNIWCETNISVTENNELRIVIQNSEYSERFIGSIRIVDSNNEVVYNRAHYVGNNFNLVDFKYVPLYSDTYRVYIDDELQTTVEYTKKESTLSLGSKYADGIYNIEGITDPEQDVILYITDKDDKLVYVGTAKSDVDGKFSKTLLPNISGKMKVSVGCRQSGKTDSIYLYFYQYRIYFID